MTEDEFSNFDVHAPGVRHGIEPTWARMRAHPELPRSDALGGFRIIARAGDVRKALLDHRLFSSAQGITIPDQGVRSRHIPAETDPPLQKAYRNLLARFFGFERVKRLEPTVRGLAAELFERIGDAERVDFVEAFARPFPVYVSLALLGLPPEDAGHLDGLVKELHEEVASGVRSGAPDRLTRYVRESLEARAEGAAPGDDTLVSAILCGEVEGRPLALEEQISMVRLILIGGFDSAAIALATSIWWLAQHPEDLERLRREPALIDPFSEEIVRFASPATYLRRTVTRDVEFAGTPLKAGDHVVLGFGAANRDPAEFSDADTVVLDRIPNAHLGFGWGVHRCIGSLVAKLEMRVMLEALLARYARVQLDETRPPTLGNGLNQGITALSVILHRAVYVAAR